MAEFSVCTHSPVCPTATADDAHTAHVVADHFEQGWARLCNGVILFDDNVFLRPTGVTMCTETITRLASSLRQQHIVA